MFTVSLTPPQYQPQFTAEQLVLGGWAHNGNPEPSSSSCLVTKAQHWSHLGAEPKQHPPKALGQVFADFLSYRHLDITTLQTEFNLQQDPKFNQIISTAFLYQGSYFSPTENIEEGSVNQKG